MDAPGIVVAVDGPSGSGKSSVSKALAARHGLRYLDTGSLYRAATVAALDAGVDLADEQAVLAAVANAEIVAGTDPAAPSISIDGRDVATRIRDAAVTGAVSQVSAHSAVRALLLRLQRQLIGGGGIVVEGRDIGTEVAPDADLKFFLTADAAVRGQRRHAERAHHADASATAEALVARDEVDANRSASPLRAADDAVTIDATELSLEQVVDRADALLVEREGRP